MIQVARQRIQVGIVHAGLTVTVRSSDTTFQVTADDQLLVEVPCTTTRPIARFKVHKPDRLAAGDQRRHNDPASASKRDRKASGSMSSVEWQLINDDEPGSMRPRRFSILRRGLQVGEQPAVLVRVDPPWKTRTGTAT
jgi:hypothetical protein